MKEFFKMFGAVMAGLFVFSIGSMIVTFLFFIMFVSIFSTTETVSIKSDSILHITLKEPVVDHFRDYDMSIDRYLSATPAFVSLRSAVLAIRKAADDPKIKGIFIETEGSSSDLTILSELRKELLKFKNSGKFIYAYSEYFGTSDFYLATAADSLFVNPQGGIFFKGLSAQIMFMKGMFDKLGLEPQIIRAGKFKSAVEPFIQDKMSNENREQYSALLSNIWGNMLNEISMSRDISKAGLQKSVNELNTIFPDDVLASGLVDGLLNKEDVISKLRKLSGKDDDENITLVTLSKYISSLGNLEQSNKGDGEVEVLYANGEIVDGKGDIEQIGSESFIEELKRIKNDENVKSVVIRINSPGGSALASENILIEVKELGKKKPVVVSMGSVAASGGYYIAAEADKIVAERYTITGSIGVFGLFISTKKLFNEHLGIYVDTVNTNTYSDFLSGYRPLTNYEMGKFQLNVNKIYSTFLTRVSEGRNLRYDYVDSIGQGRVWIAEDALRLGLVDSIGGLSEAIEIAANLAGLNNYKVVTGQSKRSFFDEFFQNILQDVRSFFREELPLEIQSAIDSYKRVKTTNGVYTRLPFDMTIN